MVICFVGYPLAGKTTIAKSIANKIKYKYFSTGDYYRKISMVDEIESIKKHDRSLICNDQINEEVIKYCLDYNNIIFDGYPRSLEQAFVLKAIRTDIYIIFIYVNPVIIYSRAENRKRDNKDSINIVTERVKSAIKLNNELKLEFGNNMVVVSNNGDIDDVRKEIECHLLKSLENF